MARGDVLRVELPLQPAGREQAGLRPAVAVQANDAGLPTLMIVPLTSQLEALRFLHTIRVEPSALNGLDRASVLLVFQLRAIDRHRIVATTGRLEPNYLEQLDQEMGRLLGLR